jgi:hypothetical protein
MSLWRVIAAVLIFYTATYVKFSQPNAVPVIRQTVESVAQTNSFAVGGDDLSACISFAENLWEQVSS